MPDIGALLDGATPRELAVTVCLDGTAAARLAELHDQRAQATDWQPASLADVDPVAALDEEIAQARAAVAEACVEFRFRAIPYTQFTALLAAHPPAAGRPDLYDEETFLPAVLAACCVAPTLSAGQVGQLLDRVNHGTAKALFDAALAVNEEPSPLPF
ncbi:hypothetical protein [Kitasatospora aureofaciens]|uniref:hypothetical protein n=1 Tax=Kitasatospora aureofaciens TaxID=1894 RepID=UPI0038075D1E